MVDNFKKISSRHNENDSHMNSQILCPQDRDFIIKFQARLCLNDEMETPTKDPTSNQEKKTIKKETLILLIGSERVFWSHLGLAPCLTVNSQHNMKALYFFVDFLS